MGVGVAADIAQQRLMKDHAALVGVEAQFLGKAHRQHARPQRKIPRLAGRQVGRIG